MVERRVGVSFELRADGTRRVSRNLNRVNRSANQLRSTLGFLRSALVVVASAAVAQQFIEFADNLVLVRNRLRLVTNSTNELNAVQHQLFQISQETRTSLEGNAQLFNRLARSTTSLNFSYRDNLKLTRAINQALRISGAQTSEARSSVIQFAQGLASGELRAEELESVTENAQRLSQIIAASSDQVESSGALRSFAREASDAQVREVLGRENIIRAIQDAYGDLNEEFQDIERTFSGAFEQLSNKMVVFLGQLNEGTRLGSIFVGTLDFIRLNLAEIVVALSALTGITVFNILATQVGAFSARIGGLFGRLSQLRVRLNKVTPGDRFGPFAAITASVRGLGNTVKFFLGGAWALLRRDMFGIVAPVRLASAAIVSFATRAIGSLLVAASTASGSVLTMRSSFRALARGGLSLATAGVKRLTAALFLNPLVIGAAAIVAGIVLVAQYTEELGDVFDGVKDAIGTLGETLDNVVGFASAGVLTVVRAWEKLPAAFGDIAVQAANALIENIQSAINSVSGLLNTVLEGVGLPTIPEAELDTFTNPFKGAANEISEEFIRAQQDIIDAGGGFDFISQKASDAVSAVREFTTLSAPENMQQLLGRQPRAPGASGGLDEGAGGGGDGSDEIENRREEARKLINTLSPLQDSLTELREKEEKLNFAQEQGIINQRERTQLQVRLLRDTSDVGNATAEYRAQQELLNMALERGAITSQEFARESANARQEFLRDQTEMSAGIERFFLDMNQQATDSAAQVESVLSESFRSVEDAFVEFVQTGKFSIRDLVDTIQAEFLRLSFRGTINQLAGSLGISGDQAQGGSGLIGGLASSAADALFGGGGVGAGTKAVAAVGSGTSTEALAAGMDPLSLSGFASGGSFDVNSANSVSSLSGIDNRLVAFRARDGERVSVTPQRDQGETPQGNVTVNMTVQTPDADSFRRSEGQIGRRVLKSAQRAQSRTT